MKKYLQTCNMNGSLYGKSRLGKKGNKQKPEEIEKNSVEAMKSYTKLYKNQSVVMERLFNKEK